MAAAVSAYHAFDQCRKSARQQQSPSCRTMTYEEREPTEL